MKKKALIIGGGAVALVAVIVALILIFTGGENAYRSIKVFEIDGSCKVERDGDTLDAFKNMALSSGDTFTVGDGSFARLKLDDDKYVYLEANTKINLTATGTANDSKTMVYIERGSMLTEVKKKLSATSSYDIVTPNTTMSIRGTKTLTEVYEDVLGAIKTSAAVVEGQVKFSTIQKDKTGKAVIVSTDLSVGQGFGVNRQ
ncbi:MAG: FecR domain-containing protein [Lachnospiraceae bacterium]|nr:FecR domain-containing protein [Lachnospiraceae bacterium]